MRSKTLAVVCTTVVAILAIGSLERILDQVQHLRHEDVLESNRRLVVIAAFLIPFLVGFLVLNRDVAEAGVAGTLALFVAPGLNLIAQIVLDDMADEWVRRESAGLLLAGILSGVLAVLGGRLRRICSYGSEPVPFAGPPRS